MLQRIEVYKVSGIGNWDVNKNERFVKVIFNEKITLIFLC